MLFAGICFVVAEAESQNADSTDTLKVKGTSQVPVVFDGNVSRFEYADATHATFPNGHGTVDVYMKRYDGFLYFAFQIPDPTVHQGDDIVVMLDTKLSRSATPGPGCIRAYVRRKLENSRMQQGVGKTWADVYSDWEFRSRSYTTGWEVECRIPLAAISVENQKAETTLGLAFRIWDNEPQKIWNWPLASHENKPDTWGTLLIEPAK